MIVWVYQKCKYKIENIKIDGIFVFLLLRKRISETRFNQNLSITKNFLKQKEQAFKKQPQCMNKNSKKKKIRNMDILENCSLKTATAKIWA